MSLPDPNFQTGGQFTAANANGIVEAILVKLQANSFDLLTQQGNITAYTYAVPDDKDQILQLNSYLDVSIAEPDGINVIVAFTRIGGGDPFRQTLNSGGNIGDNVGFDPGQTFAIKAKRGTDVIITVQAAGVGTYDVGGSLTVLKNIS